LVHYFRFKIDFLGPSGNNLSVSWCRIRHFHEDRDRLMYDAARPINKLIAKKRHEVGVLKAQLDALQAHLETAVTQLETLELALSAVSRSAPVSKGEPLGLKPGSVMDQAYKYIQSAGRPVHIKEIVQGIGLEYDDKTNRTVSSQLNVYVNKGRYFTRTAPSTFGITEFGGDSE
jgi:hypothetical protein